MVIKNIQRLAEVNERFAYMGDFDWKADGENKIVVDTGKDVYPMLKNDLASPECGMIDLDATTDFDKDPVCTGPFVITEFNPEGDVTVARNENYWGGDVKLDGAVFYYMQEDDPKLLAMQSGEIDCYNSVSSGALEVYEKEPDKYNVESVAGTRLQYYILNENRLDDAVREAINLTVDKDAIADYLKGTVSAAHSPYPDSTAYSKVTIPAVDTDKAKKLLEDDGYTLNSEGIYEKDGQPLKINIAYYAARSLDTLAVLMQEQLKAVGIDSYLTVEEDPDSTYIATADFDIALYCMISDKCGDPQYFIDSTLADGAYYNVGGFESAECEAMIKQLKTEVDTDKRADLANKIIQIAIDDNAFGYVGLFNHTTVMKPGVSGFAEKIPFDFYGIDANTVK
jgi:peptide/nickel transport system substrate-binding protein